MKVMMLEKKMKKAVMMSSEGEFYQLCPASAFHSYRYVDCDPYRTGEGSVERFSQMTWMTMLNIILVPNPWVRSKAEYHQHMKNEFFSMLLYIWLLANKIMF